MSTRVQKAMVNPINVIFKYLQTKARVQIWLYEQKNLRLEGQILGFDEFMNVVLGEAKEIHVKKGTETELGRILLKGDNITLIHEAGAA
ncbi:LSM-domain-containing protein [Coemansia reversa NRRL 1564]|uniref:Small nuclear ribonucleoprotein E n=1 Tax=Coemansia reversa (strain ATCC 12441 / NRRL 1564) TaxID=763665 RepID=A0A2G5BI75_COERN|nr:LSM-domain-containing protein [Coemansia reversa NRRL 1564]|eukprot:PIA18724.1 LSM-domain-containing protein [Coemansia reversa NRRL 1564]